VPPRPITSASSSGCSAPRSQDRKGNRRKEDDALQRRPAFDRAVARRVQVVAPQHLQPQPHRVGRRHLGRQRPDEALAALDHAAHDQRLQAVEVESALGIAAGALGPATPGIFMGRVRPAGGNAGADRIAGPEGRSGPHREPAGRLCPPRRRPRHWRCRRRVPRRRRDCPAPPHSRAVPATPDEAGSSPASHR
jgi:hypothetical protein